MSTLDVEGITKTFGGLTAVNDVSLVVAPGRITSLIGPNGAGKTTFFNCITGVLEPDAGAVTLDGDDLAALTPDGRARRGIGRTFQRLEVFTGLTVFENLQVAAEATRPGATFLGAFRFRHPDEPAVVERVESVIERLGLGDVARQVAGDLPTGALRLVELGRALCTDPTVLLLDELASGLDEHETEELGGILQGIADDGLAVLLIEHDIELVLAISKEIYVLDFGSIIAHGSPDEIARNSRVRTAYIGAEGDASGASTRRKGGRRAGAVGG